MQEQHVFANTPPFLEKLNASSWSDFLDAYEGYKARGGVRNIMQLVSNQVLRIISIRLHEADEPPVKGEKEGRDEKDDSEIEEERFISLVSRMFAPSSSLESFDRFKKLNMPNARGISMDALLSFILDFEKEQQRCRNALPSDKHLRKLFVDKLKPARLAERVRFRDPDSLDNAKRMALEEAEVLRHMATEISMVHAMYPELPLETGSRKPATVPGNRRPVSEAPVKKEVIKCHECGEIV
eukprot:ANDGO_07155.mRNA.1 hypothetical protein